MYTQQIYTHSIFVCNQIRHTLKHRRRRRCVCFENLFTSFMLLLLLLLVHLACIVVGAAAVAVIVGIAARCCRHHRRCRRRRLHTTNAVDNAVAAQLWTKRCRLFSLLFVALSSNYFVAVSFVSLFVHNSLLLILIYSNLFTFLFKISRHSFSFSFSFNYTLSLIFSIHLLFVFWGINSIRSIDFHLAVYLFSRFVSQFLFNRIKSSDFFFVFIT